MTSWKTSGVPLNQELDSSEILWGAGAGTKILSHSTGLTGTLQRSWSRAGTRVWEWQSAGDFTLSETSSGSHTSQASPHPGSTELSAHICVL